MGGRKLVEKKKLYVGNLSFEVTEGDLKELFSEAGTVESVSMITDRHSGRSKGFAFVEMSSDAEAKEATSKFNGYSFKERELVVNEARPRSTSRDSGARGRY